MSFNKRWCRGQGRRANHRPYKGTWHALSAGFPGALCATAVNAGSARGEGTGFVQYPLFRLLSVGTRSVRPACLD